MITTMMGFVDTFILCGGRGMRMGGINKGRLKLCGKDFVKILYDEFSQLGDVHIVGREEDFPEYPTLRDYIENSGPVGGILSALKFSSTQKVLIVPCDSPLFSKEHALYLLDNIDGYEISAFFTEKPTPIPGIYRKNLFDDLRKFFKNGGRSISRFVLSRRSIFIHPRSWISVKGVNTPQEYSEILKLKGC